MFPKTVSTVILRLAYTAVPCSVASRSTIACRTSIESGRPARWFRRSLGENSSDPETAFRSPVTEGPCESGCNSRSTTPTVGHS